MAKFKLKNKQDIKAESITGVRFQFDDDVWFQSRRAGGTNAKYTAALQVVNQKLLREFGSRPIPQERRKIEQAKLYAETCLIDWSMPGEDGPIPFSPDTAFELLRDPEYDIYYTELDNRVGDPRSFLMADDDGGETAKQVADSVGN